MDEEVFDQSKTGHAKQTLCGVQGCDGELMRDERKKSILLPCECDFKICKACFDDVVETGGGICPGCKEAYDVIVMDELAADNESTDTGKSKMESKKKTSTTDPGFMSSTQIGDLEFSALFETKGTYGYGNAIWPRDGNGTESEYSELFKKQQWRPLTRKVKISAVVLGAYRFLFFVRMIVLMFFLRWRITNPNNDAFWLWIMSVICEIWFAFSWLIDQLPKLNPVNRSANLGLLKEKFETPTAHNPEGKSDLPGIDVFVSTADPEKEPPLVTANTILSILAADYPVEKLFCYVSDDGGSLYTFEALEEAASFAKLWVPFCRKYEIEPRNPESYFNLKRDPYKNKVEPKFVRNRRKVKREYDEFKVRINGLPALIQQRSNLFNSGEEVKTMGKFQKENKSDEPVENLKIPNATRMADGTCWSGTWIVPAPGHSRADHEGIVKVLLKPPSNDLVKDRSDDDGNPIDLSEVDNRLPMLVYISREKRPGYDHNKKAGAMNALVRASAIMSNGPFVLNLDCDHYIYTSQAIREGMCFMMDRGGDRICYVQFPQRFEGIDPSDRYANHNTVFFDANMRALDGLQGPLYVGTGCLFRRMAIYGFDPPRCKKPASVAEEERWILAENDHEILKHELVSKGFGNSILLVDSIPEAEFGGRPLADHQSVENGRQPGALCNNNSQQNLDASRLSDAIHVISCLYEYKTKWGKRIGWIYGSITEDVLTGYRMHNRGWRSVYYVPKCGDAFRGTAPINLTDRLHQVLRWATGSVEIFFSRNNCLLASPRMKVLQRVAYLNVAIYPFTSIFVIVYCFLPAFSLFSGQFIVQTLNVNFLLYLLAVTLTLCMLAGLEIKWSGIQLEEWWRNEQFWLIAGTSAHVAAVLQVLLKIIAGITITFKLTSKSANDDEDEDFADLYTIKWTSLMILPVTIIMTNLIAIAFGVLRTINSVIPLWSRLVGGVFFSFWVLAHLYPFAKGLMGRRGRTPTLVFLWSGLITIVLFFFFWVKIHPPFSALQMEF